MIRQFLVTRRDGKLARVEAFDDPDAALRAYHEVECYEMRRTELRQESVLLGADRLATCIATHGNWFDEPLDPLFPDVQ